MIGMTQEVLGRKLGITFQQVQKYEKGANRVGASRLQQIAEALGVTPAWFFENAPTQSGGKTLTLDTKTGHIFLIAADYGPVPADAPPLSNGRIARGPMLPDSFTILEVGR